MKRILAFLLAAAMMTGVTSCREKDPETPDPSGGGYTETVPSGTEDPTGSSGVNVPGKPSGGTATPGKPSSGTAAPGTPSGGTTAPGTPSGGTTAPGTPSGGTTAPGTPSGGTAAPETPSGGTTAPGTSSGGATTPETPSASVEEPLVIMVQPADAETLSGETVIFTVHAAGGKTPYTYKWQLKDASSGWRTASGGVTETLTRVFSTPELQSGLEFCCVITDAAGNSVTSAAAKVTLKSSSSPSSGTPSEPTTPAVPDVPEGSVTPEIPAEKAELSIVQQPENVVAKTGEQVSFTVVVTGGKMPYSYKWQRKSGFLGTWTDITVSPTSELIVTTSTAENEKPYRCVVTDADGKSVTSEAVSITVESEQKTVPLTITKQPVDAVSVNGGSVIFRVTVSGGKAPYTYQWQGKNRLFSSWTALANGNQAEITIEAPSDVRSIGSYRCVITDAAGEKATTNTVTFTIETITLKPVADPLVITSQPEDKIGATGSIVMLSIDVSGGTEPYTYLWQKQDSYSGVWQKEERGAGKALSLDPKMHSGWYRCVVTDKNGEEVISREVQVTAAEAEVPLEITGYPMDVDFTGEGTYGFAITFVGGKAPYDLQWQTRTDDSASWSPVASQTLAAAGTGAADIRVTTHRQVRCVVTDSAGNQQTSGTAYLREAAEGTRPSVSTRPSTTTRPSISTALTITSQPVYTPVLEGMQIVYKVEVSGGKSPYTYQWQAYQSIGGGEPMWWDLADKGDDGRWEGAESSQLTWTASEADRTDNVKLRCVVTDSAGSSVTTDGVNIFESSASTRPSTTPRPSATRALTITSQPVYTPVLEGMQIVYKVEVSGGKVPYTYQWQAYQSIGGDPMWWDLADKGDGGRWEGAESSQLTWTASEADRTDNVKLRCVITDVAGTTVITDGVNIFQ